MRIAEGADQSALADSCNDRCRMDLMCVSPLLHVQLVNWFRADGQLPIRLLSARKIAWKQEDGCRR